MENVGKQAKKLADSTIDPVDICLPTALRDVVRGSFDVEEYEPRNTAAWDDAYERFLKVVE